MSVSSVQAKILQIKVFGFRDLFRKMGFRGPTDPPKKFSLNSGLARQKAEIEAARRRIQARRTLTVGRLIDRKA